MEGSVGVDEIMVRFWKRRDDEGSGRQDEGAATYSRLLRCEMAVWSMALVLSLLVYSYFMGYRLSIYTNKLATQMQELQWMSTGSPAPSSSIITHRPNARIAFPICIFKTPAAYATFPPTPETTATLQAYEHPIPSASHHPPPAPSPTLPTLASPHAPHATCSCTP